MCWCLCQRGTAGRIGKSVHAVAVREHKRTLWKRRVLKQFTTVQIKYTKPFKVMNNHQMLQYKTYLQQHFENGRQSRYRTVHKVCFYQFEDILWILCFILYGVSTVEMRYRLILKRFHSFQRIQFCTFRAVLKAFTVNIDIFPKCKNGFVTCLNAASNGAFLSL